MLLIAALSLVILMLAGVPIVFALGLSSVLALYFASDVPLMVVAQRMVGQIDSFALLAVPFFVLVGEVMERGGIARRLVRVASCLVGHLRGGLAQVNIVTSMLFSGISGASAADASAVGSLLIPAMAKRGYKRAFAAALTASAATMGPLIPPSTLAIIYGAIANISIGKLFLAGLVPGILVGVGLMIAVHLFAVRLDLPVEGKTSLTELRDALRDAAWALLVPIIVVGGILVGIFTATESGAVAAIYSVIVSMFVYRELRASELPGIFVRSAVTTGMVMIVIAAAGVFAWILASQNLPFLLRDAVLAVTENSYVALLIILVLMLAIGCVMEIVAAGIIMIPVLYPLARHFGFDDVHFALLIIMTMAIGAVTPPVGVTTFITMGIAGTSLSETTRYLWPFLVVLILVLALVALVPATATFVPNLVFGK